MKLCPYHFQRHDLAVDELLKNEQFSKCTYVKVNRKKWREDDRNSFPGHKWLALRLMISNHKDIYTY